MSWVSPESWRLCVAPMIDVTDRHCRFFHRLLAPRALLYTEMITTGALLHGDAGRHLEYDAAEHPVALQLGGSEPDALARAARLGEQAGYDEINLNCGCPSERVQQGAFGACLMAEPQLVADCIQAMREVVQVPVTVKHRLGLDDEQSYGFVRDFVGVQYEAGCRVFVVHARNAVLKGLSPKENRQIPPLRYAFARQLKQDFPDCVIVLNGGLATAEQAEAEGQGLDGVMLGRAAWHQPEVLRELSQRFWPGDASLDDTDVLQRYAAYTERMVAQGVPMRILVRPLLGWGNGRKGARRWRQMLSDHRLLGQEDPGLLLRAWEQVA
ncbi:tRNA dihydrouridine(20/20a) synthase DusA [Kerstersia gyiorum]|jgi:tRNA-dihydrouridine synthase A|nr:tRNA dihydrouridine(20/20a) synthase DusA [Kerstersia gyiorum]AZV95420.1 tRNA dihydrouridine(20/20a) synthase DusA [Bordetella sp. J329]MCH4272203.1 tRNA dihydrouridine(20/20a) synthase DusA [Kerstersia gyiorum]MCI1228072.1 tRNA dihydrouridine(20/20a) synthase DusA [Kerstersia gyiorum]